MTPVGFAGGLTRRLGALEDALRIGTPEIFNTNQGSQFTSLAFTQRVLSSGARM